MALRDQDGIPTQPFRAGLTFGGRPSGPHSGDSMKLVFSRKLSQSISRKGPRNCRPLHGTSGQVRFARTVGRGRRDASLKMVEGERAFSHAAPIGQRRVNLDKTDFQASPFDKLRAGSPGTRRVSQAHFLCVAAARAVSTARTTAFALLTDSSYSSSGTESATIPPPACM
jgi:hypothetical protein